MTARRFTEWELQKASADLMRTCLRPGAFAFHVPNERQSAIQRQILAGGGTLSGVADWIILVPQFVGFDGDIGRAYALELKAGRRGLSPAQEAFRKLCEGASVPYHVARSLDEVIDALRDLGLLREGVV